MKNDCSIEREQHQKIFQPKNKRQLTESAPNKVFLAHKEKNQKLVKIEEIIFYLKSRYLERNKNRTIISNIPSKVPSFEVITNNLETFLKPTKIRLFQVDGY